MNQTEPIGFKGTKGEWSFDGAFNYEFGIFEPSGLNILHVQRVGITEAEANAKLLAASKSMSIALQECVECLEHGTKEYEMAILALKQAGL